MTDEKPAGFIASMFAKLIFVVGRLYKSMTKKCEKDVPSDEIDDIYKGL